MSTRILITGATGFVGGHLVEQLVEKGYGVRALVRPTSNVATLQSYDVEIIRGDIRNPKDMEEAVDGCAQVYHLAGVTTRSAESHQACYAVNVEGAKNVARAALNAGSCRVVYSSSVGVYGLLAKQPADEDTEPRPNTHYRRSKWMGEEVFRTYHEQHGLPVVIVRLPSLLGPGTLNWLKWFGDLAAERSLMVGPGDNRKQFGYITDVVDGLCRCGEKEGIDGECYVLAGPTPQPFKQLVRVATSELGAGLPTNRWPAFPFNVFYRLADAVYRHARVELPYAHTCEFFLSEKTYSTAKAENEIRYRPRVSAEEGVRRTIRWYIEQGYIGQ